MIEQFNAACARRTDRPQATVSRAAIFGAVFAIALASSSVLAAQKASDSQAPSASKAQVAPGSGTDKNTKVPETKITPEQAKQLFALVDQLMKFSSQET